MRSDDEEKKLVDRLRKIEALFARPGSAGERAAAKSARDRLRDQLGQLARTGKRVEYRFTPGDPWAKALFIALLRRYDLKPYRHRGQHPTTVVVLATRTLVREVLWPQFEQLRATLRDHLNTVTRRVIAEAIHQR